MMEMMMRYKAMWALVVVLMLGACADEDEMGGKHILNLMPYAETYAEVEGTRADGTRVDGTRADGTRVEALGTRAVPAGYEQIVDVAGDYVIKTYLARQDAASGWVCKPAGEYRYKGSGVWQSTVEVENTTQYYLYGYMPAGSATGEITSADYSQGATLTLRGLNVVNPADVCVVTGVSNSKDDMTLGCYGFQTGDGSEEDKVYLLMEHIYTKVAFEYAVDETYNELRTIKLRRVEMTLPTASPTVTATVQLAPNNMLPMTCTFAPEGGEAPPPVTLLDAETTLTTSYQAVPGYVIPGQASVTLKLTSTYDVYDKSGNCVRQGCEATNKITLDEATAGRQKTVKMRVTPTYLYQMSEPDLDNPVVKAESI